VTRGDLGGDAQQPRASIIGRGSVAGPPAERTREHLRGEVVGQAVSNPPSEVVVDQVVMTLEEHPERLRVLERADDHRLVRQRRCRGL
jgi:hypothetical protein